MAQKMIISLCPINLNYQEKLIPLKYIAIILKYFEYKTFARSEGKCTIEGYIIFID